MTGDDERRYRELVEQAPDAPMGHFTLGRFLLGAGRYQEAVESLREAVRLDPGYAAALLALGDAFLAGGDARGAKAAWEDARRTALGQEHQYLADEIEDRMSRLNADEG